jgi:selenocysteine-specific elongation factor
LQSKRLDKILEHLKSNRRIIRYDAAENKLVHGDFFELIRKRILERLAAFHNDQPLREGISKQELRSTIPGSDKLFRSVLEHLVSKLEVEDLGDLIRLAGHQVKLKEDEKGLQDKIFSLIQKGKNQPPLLKEIIVAVGSDQKRIRSLLGILEKEGKIVRVKDEIYFSSEYVSEVKAKLIDYIKKHGGVTPSQFNEITASSRKYNIPLLEYFDREKFTLRVGDQRVLRGSAASGDGGKAV